MHRPDPPPGPVMDLLRFLGGHAPARPNPPPPDDWQPRPDGLVQRLCGEALEVAFPGDPDSIAWGWVGTPKAVAARLHEVGAYGAADLARAQGDGPLGWIEYVGVHPDRRRDGRGERLLVALLAALWARGATALWGEVGSDDDDATDRDILVPWYARHGFRLDPAGEGRSVMVADSRPRAEGTPPVRANPGRAERLDACGAPSPGTARRQVPALFHKIPWRRGTLNADLGGGPWPDATRFLARRGVTNVVVDPGWQDAEAVLDARTKVLGGRADTVTLANVLNVVPTAAGRAALLALAAHALAPGGVAYVSCYEGDGHGHGGPTRDGWQAHRPLASYAPELRRYFGEVSLSHDRIEARRPRPVEAPPLVCPGGA